MELCTATNVIILCIVLFLYNLFTSVSLLVDSPIGHGGELSEELNIGPLWDRGQNFSICSYLSTSKYFSSIQLSKKQTLFHHKNVVFTNHGSEDDIKIKINIQDEKYAGLYRNDLPLQHDSIDAFASESIWSLIRGNKTTIYLHVLLLKQQNKQHLLSGIGSYNDDDSDFLDSDGYPDRIDQNLFAKGNGLHSALSLLKMAKIPTSYADRYLLSDAAKSSIWKTCDRFSSGLLSKYLITPISVIEQTQQELWKKNPNEIVTFWKPEVIVRTVNDWTLWSMETIPDALIRNLIQINENGDMYRYKPHIHVDEIGITSDKFIALNSTSGQQGGLPLMISYGKLSLHHWLFSSAIEDGMKVQKDSIGFGDKDLDDVRRLFTDTPLWLLAITVLASCLHLLFELLAFQSDIDFWKNNQSLTGLSARALVTDLISQSIVFLFLYNSDTSLIVLGPALVGILIQVRYFYVVIYWDLRYFKVRFHLDFLGWASSMPIGTTSKCSLNEMKYATYYIYCVLFISTLVYILTYLYLSPVTTA